MSGAAASSDLPVLCLLQSAAPGVSHQEPGGLTTRQAIDAIHSIPGNIIGCDLVELNPDVDHDFMATRVAAKIMKELASAMVASSGTQLALVTEE